MYLGNLIDFEQEAESPISKFKEKLLKHRFKVFRSPEKSPFITNDNPGFTISEGGKVSHLALDEACLLALPLTRYLLFGINFSQSDMSKEKYIDYEDVDKDFVCTMNKATAYLCTRNIYSNDKSILSKFI